MTDVVQVVEEVVVVDTGEVVDLVTVAEIGPKGDRGPEGPAGAVSREYPHPDIADTWTIEHGLGRRPLVQVYDESGMRVLADVSHPDLNTVQIGPMVAPLSGLAILA